VHTQDVHERPVPLLADQELDLRLWVVSVAEWVNQDHRVGILFDASRFAQVT
jgi:hypothetical protein